MIHPLSPRQIHRMLHRRRRHLLFVRIGRRGSWVLVWFGAEGVCVVETCEIEMRVVRLGNGTFSYLYNNEKSLFTVLPHLRFDVTFDCRPQTSNPSPRPPTQQHSTNHRYSAAPSLTEYYPNHDGSRATNRTTNRQQHTTNLLQLSYTGGIPPLSRLQNRIRHVIQTRIHGE